MGVGGGGVGGWVGVGEMELKKKESAWGRKRKIELNNKKEGGRRRKRRKMPKQGRVTIIVTTHGQIQ